MVFTGFIFGRSPVVKGFAGVDMSDRHGSSTSSNQQCSRQVVHPPFSTRTLGHPSLMPLYMAAMGSAHHPWRPHQQPVPVLTPSEVFYTDPTGPPGRRVPNTVTELQTLCLPSQVFEYFQLNTPRPIMSSCPAPPIRRDPFRTQTHPTRDLGSNSWTRDHLRRPINPIPTPFLARPRERGPNRAVIQLTLEEDQAITNLLKLYHHHSPCPEVTPTSASTQVDTSEETSSVNNLSLVEEMGHTANLSLVEEMGHTANLSLVEEMGHTANLSLVEEMGHTANLSLVEEMGHTANLSLVEEMGHTANLSLVEEMGHTANLSLVEEMGHTANLSLVEEMGHTANLSLVEEMGHTANLSLVEEMGHTANLSLVEEMGHTANLSLVEEMGHTANFCPAEEMGLFHREDQVVASAIGFSEHLQSCDEVWSVQSVVPQERVTERRIRDVSMMERIVSESEGTAVDALLGLYDLSATTTPLDLSATPLDLSATPHDLSATPMPHARRGPCISSIYL
ncbi:hypothetical protein DPEC_G00103830 [Dallia pectoralis]|uniref:Uncharacterized protein n=1 Tax=Dallia pectoralis TaxID=75939 RepID=A0ACC2GXG1_DALPE|nr:hypothetical protein DPEC_G00103830 [Dallia pectoralis]